jgi:hypothetical protein
MIPCLLLERAAAQAALRNGCTDFLLLPILFGVTVQAIDVRGMLSRLVVANANAADVKLSPRVDGALAVLAIVVFGLHPGPAGTFLTNEHCPSFPD